MYGITYSVNEELTCELQWWITSEDALPVRVDLQRDVGIRVVKRGGERKRQRIRGFN